MVVVRSDGSVVRYYTAAGAGAAALAAAAITGITKTARHFAFCLDVFHARLRWDGRRDEANNDGARRRKITLISMDLFLGEGKTSGNTLDSPIFLSYYFRIFLE